MATFAPSGRIDLTTLEAEKERLKRLWSGRGRRNDALEDLLGAQAVASIDPFDQVQLAEVVRVCRRSRSLSEAGRILFSASRSRRSSSNDADRLRKYLQRYGLEWGELHAV
jgi:transcriptional regulatory protein RtcR